MSEKTTDLKEVTIAELQKTYNLTAPEANGLIKSLEKLGHISVVGERAPVGNGKGRKSKVYGVPASIALSL